MNPRRRAIDLLDSEEDVKVLSGEWIESPRSEAPAVFCRRPLLRAWPRV
jgi:hypothetical protein